MDENSQATDHVDENPYAPPPIIDAPEEYIRPFQWWYWALLFGMLAVCLVVIFILPPAGVVGVVAVAFALIRSQLQVVRINREKLTAVSQAIAAEPIVYLFSSIALGILASIASSIAFVAICIPTGFLGMTLVQSSPSMQLESIVILASVIFGLVVAVWLGVFILRRSLR
jgi:hypothetical protein